MNHVDQATSDGTKDATRNATWNATKDATLYATWNATVDATWDATGVILQFTDRATSEFTSSLCKPIDRW